MGVRTHVMEYSGETVASMGRGVGPLQFLGPLRALNGAERWNIVFYALPPGKSYEDIAGEPTLEYLQAAGKADAMTIEIRKPGGEQWGADWVRYVVGHPHDGNPPLDVPIDFPNSTQTVSAAEIFDAEEAAQLFMSYHRTGDIPAEYILRPIEGYTAGGELIRIGVATA